MAQEGQVRPLASMQVPIQARLDLRDGMYRWLPHARSQEVWLGDGSTIEATVLLDFCLHHRISYAGGDQKLALKWDRTAKRNGRPKFSELQADGWVVFDGIRWVHPRVPIGMMNAVVYPDEVTKDFLQGLDRWQLSAAGRPVTRQAKDLANEAKAGRLQLDDLREQRDSRWVAMRLWEGLCPTAQDAPAAAVDEAFRDWAAWCDVLRGFAEWDDGWPDAAKNRCREAAQRVLDKQQVWGPWGNDVERYVSVMTGAFGLPSDHFPSLGITYGATLITRFDWVNSPAISRLNAERFRGASAGFAFGLLLSELKRADVIGIEAGPAAFVSRFVAEHPVALFNLSLAVTGAPVLLVDLLLQPRTACLVVRMIAEWVPSGRAWDRDISDRRSEQTKAFALQDALSALAYHLKRSDLNLDDLAALATWCFSAGLGTSAVSTAPQRLSLGKLVVSMIADQTQDTQQEVFLGLVQKASIEGHTRFGVFGAIVEAALLMPDLQLADARGAVELYILMARSFQLDRTDVAALSPPLAAALVEIAAAQPIDIRDSFLRPVDVPVVLSAASVENAVSVRSGLASTLRPHIRMLARAVAGWPQSAVPAFLIDALVNLTRQAVVDHAERGRIAALGDGYAAFRFFSSERGSPGEDLAAAWRRLDDSSQDQLLTALEAADDPVLLANLTGRLPEAGRSRIRARLLRLVPDEASTAWTWTELSNRVEALIRSKELDLALAHLERAEVAVERAPTKEHLRLFALKLQLLIERQSWSELDAVTVSERLKGPDSDQAKQHLEFSRATAQLLRVDGNVAQAYAVLSQLSARSKVPAYKENAIAAAIRLLDAAKESSSALEFQVRASRLIAEIDLELAARHELGIASDGMIENRASLLLTLQRPLDALATLARIRHKGTSTNAELLASVAKGQLGLYAEAKAILETALQAFGPDPRLVEAMRELERSLPEIPGQRLSSGEADQPNEQSPPGQAHEVPVPTPAPVVLVAVEPVDPTRLISQMRSMAAEEVGLLFSDKGLNGYLLSEVCDALSALQQLAPILREPPREDSERRPEDDLTALVGKVLGAALSFVGWHVAEQPPGGPIRKRNMGQRDLVIRANSNREVSIYEALVCTERPNLRNMWEHFIRLLTYGQVRVYFHVTYAYADVEKVIAAWDRLIEQEPPVGMKLEGREPVTHRATPGTIATYTLDNHTFWVVFLVVDLGLKNEARMLAADMPSFAREPRSSSSQPR